MMDHATAQRCVELMATAPSVHTVDITGGAPELNAEFRRAALASRMSLNAALNLIPSISVAGMVVHLKSIAELRQAGST